MSILIFICAVGILVSHLAAAMPNLVRKGSRILLNDGSNTIWRSNGWNNYALGIDQNCNGRCNMQQPSHNTNCGFTHMTDFSIDDTIRTIAATSGGQYSLMRSHTVGMSGGHPWSFEYELNKFNASALRAADYAVYVAQKYNVYIVAPLVNQWHYGFENSHQTFCRWNNVSIAAGTACRDQFYNISSPTAASFFAYVRARLAHINPFTGRATQDEPNILWESGNELLMATPEWTMALGRLVKNLTNNTALYVSGTDSLSIGEIWDSDSPVDVVDTHYYPPNIDVLKLTADLVAKFDRVYLAGEYGWNYNSSGGSASARKTMAATSAADGAYLQQFLATAARHPAVLGALAWELYGHCSVYGLEQHGDSFTANYPGSASGSAFVEQRMQIMQDAAFSLKTPGLPTMCATIQRRPDLRFNVTVAPLLAPFPIAGVAQPRMAWRGSAGATGYQVERSTKPTSSAGWVVVASNLNDNDLPWVDMSAAAAKNTEYGYRVRPVAHLCNVTTYGPYSNVIVVGNKKV